TDPRGAAQEIHPLLSQGGNRLPREPVLRHAHVRAVGAAVGPASAGSDDRGGAPAPPTSSGDRLALPEPWPMRPSPGSPRCRSGCTRCRTISYASRTSSVPRCLPFPIQEPPRPADTGATVDTENDHAPATPVADEERQGLRDEQGTTLDVGDSRDESLVPDPGAAADPRGPRAGAVSPGRVGGGRRPAGGA